MPPAQISEGLQVRNNCRIELIDHVIRHTQPESDSGAKIQLYTLQGGPAAVTPDLSRGLCRSLRSLPIPSVRTSLSLSASTASHVEISTDHHLQARSGCLHRVWISLPSFLRANVANRVSCGSGMGSARKAMRQSWQGSKVGTSYNFLTSA